MGLGVSATGVYKSIAEKIANSVIGKVGDELGALFYAENDQTYKSLCSTGLEEESGGILCKAKLKSGEDSHDIIHLFFGEYSGPDGELPPLNIAKKFKLSSTR